MAISSKDIEVLWKRYQENGSNEESPLPIILNRMAFLITHLRNGYKETQDGFLFH